MNDVLLMYAVDGAEPAGLLAATLAAEGRPVTLCAAEPVQQFIPELVSRSSAIVLVISADLPIESTILDLIDAVKFAGRSLHLVRIDDSPLDERLADEVQVNLDWVVHRIDGHPAVEHLIQLVHGIQSASTRPRGDRSMLLRPSEPDTGVRIGAAPRVGPAPTDPAKPPPEPVRHKRPRTAEGLLEHSLQKHGPRRKADNAPPTLHECTVFAPPRVQRALPFMVQAFVHGRSERGAVAEMAAEFDEETKRRGFRTLPINLMPGHHLTFHLAAPGMSVSGSEWALDWREEAEAVQFEVHVPDDAAGGSRVLTLTLGVNGVPVGEIKFVVQVVDDVPQDDSSIPLGDSSTRYRLAFISYASADREEVIKRVQALVIAGVDFFQDVLSLDPGDRFEQEIYRKIDECDLFLLFWSSAARDSKWVMAEVRYAMNRKGGDEMAPPAIIPLVIEGPPPVEPPAELAHLHFNDRLIYFR